MRVWRWCWWCFSHVRNFAAFFLGPSSSHSGSWLSLSLSLSLESLILSVVSSLFLFFGSSFCLHLCTKTKMERRAKSIKSAFLLHDWRRSLMVAMTTRSCYIWCIQQNGKADTSSSSHARAIHSSLFHCALTFRVCYTIFPWLNLLQQQSFARKATSFRFDTSMYF